MVACVDGLEEGLSIDAPVVGRALSITVDCEIYPSGNRTVSVEDEWLQELHALDDENVILKDDFSISTRQKLNNAALFKANRHTQLQDVGQHPGQRIQ